MEFVGRMNKSDQRNTEEQKDSESDMKKKKNQKKKNIELNFEPLFIYFCFKFLFLGVFWSREEEIEMGSQGIKL